MGVVHQETVAVTVDLEGVDRPVFGMVVGGVFLERRLHLGSQFGALGSQGGLSVDFGQDFGSLAQRSHGKEIRRHEKEERRRIVRGTEYRSDQPDGIHRIALAHVADRIELAVGHTHERIGADTLLALLFTERLENVSDGRHPMFVEHRIVARHQPVFIGQAQRIAQRVDLPLAFVQFGAHLGLVAHPLMVGVRVVGVEERIGIGIELDALELAADHAGQHTAQVLVLVGQLEVGPHLRTRVTEPHGMDVSGINHRVVLAVVVLAVAHRRVERVGKTVLEHPGQLGIGEHTLDARDLGLDGLGAEQTLGLGRTVGRGIFFYDLRFGPGHTRIVHNHNRGFGFRSTAAERRGVCRNRTGHDEGRSKASPGDVFVFHSRLQNYFIRVLSYQYRVTGPRRPSSLLSRCAHSQRAAVGVSAARALA